MAHTRQMAQTKLDLNTNLENLGSCVLLLPGLHSNTLLFQTTLCGTYKYALVASLL